MLDFQQLAATLLIPAATSALVAGLLLYGLPAAAARYALATAAAVGFATGASLFPEALPFVPERHWHWLPYLGIVAAWLGSLCLAGGVQWWERQLAYAVIAAIAAAVLVPNYADLNPARPVLVPLLAIYFYGLIRLLSLLPAHLRGWRFTLLLTLAAGGTAVLIASESSLRVATLALRVPAAIAACSLVAWFMKSTRDAELEISILALLPVYAVLVGGGAFVGAVEAPKWPMLVAPAAPLTLWLFAAGPLARLRGWKAAVIQLALVLAVPIALLIWLNLNASTPEW